MEFKEACHRLRITPTLLKWFTRYAAKNDGRKLVERVSGDFDAAELDAFDAHLRTAWQSKNVPSGIEMELMVEACGHCGLCNDPCEKLQIAHIERKGVEVGHYFQHPGNLIALCGSCHDRYDDQKLKAVSFQVVRTAKDRLVSRMMESIDRDVERARVVRETIEDMKAEWSAKLSELIADFKRVIGPEGDVTRAVLGTYEQEAAGRSAPSSKLWDLVPDYVHEEHECSRCGAGAVVESATCCNCEHEVFFGEELSVERDLDGSYRIYVPIPARTKHDLGRTEVLKCVECGSETWNVEFDTFCGYCRHMADR